MRVGGRGLGRNGLNVLVVSVAVNLGPALHRGLSFVTTRSRRRPGFLIVALLLLLIVVFDDEDDAGEDDVLAVWGGYRYGVGEDGNREEEG
ncbi:hypothetical protein ACFXTH_035407 [Malus domestica]